MTTMKSFILVELHAELVWKLLTILNRQFHLLCNFVWYYYDDDGRWLCFFSVFHFVDIIWIELVIIKVKVARIR